MTEDPTNRTQQLYWMWTCNYIVLYLLFVSYNGLMMDLLNPQYVVKLLKGNISCVLADDLSYLVY